MINLIWSGKRVGDDIVVDYTEDYLYLNNDAAHSDSTDPLSLNFVNGHSDELNLIDKKLYQNIGVFDAVAQNIYIFSALNDSSSAFINDGNSLYVDFNALNETVY